MPPPSPYRAAAVATFKFAGVGTLGLLTGSALTHSTLTAPALLALPTPSAAARALAHIYPALTSAHRRLSYGAAALLAAAFAASPRGWRHPYLLWSAAVAAGTAAWGAKEEGAAKTEGSDPGWDAIERVELGMSADEVNGEAVGERVRVWRGALVWEAAGYGLAAAVGLLGIWGDRAAWR